MMIDPDDPMTVIDKKRGVRVRKSIRDAAPGEVFIIVGELDRYGPFASLPGRRRFVSTDEPIVYTFDMVEWEWGLSRVTVTSNDGVRRPLSLTECRSILIEALPLLERAWFQWHEDLRVDSIFLD